MEDLNPIDAGQGESVVDTTGASADATPAASAAPQAGAPNPAQQIAEQFYDVKIGGQTRKVPLSELTSGYQRHQDYTQKTMQLAEERRQLQTQWESERTQVREFLSKRENVQQILQALEQQQQLQPQPNQPLTMQQVQHMLQQHAQQSQHQLAQQRQEIALEQQTTQYAGDIKGHIDTILKQHPELSSIRRIDKILKEEALDRDPATLDEAKQYILEAAQTQLDAIRQHFLQQQKQAAVSQQTLAKGIEAPGGAAPMPAGKTFKLGDPRLTEDVVASLKAMMQG